MRGRIRALALLAVFVAASTMSASARNASWPDGIAGLDPPLDAVPAGVRALVASIPRADTDVLLAYWRPDGRYDLWNLWTWGAGAAGRRAFTGVAGDRGIPGASVAYLRAPRTELFPGSATRLGFLVRTDAWEKDPGTDMHWDLALDSTLVVLSGNPEPQALAARVPRILGAEPVEVSPGRFALRVRTHGRLRLTPIAARRAAGFRIASEGRGTPPRIAGVRAEDDDALLLLLPARVPRERLLELTHPLLAGSAAVRIPAEPLPAPPLPAAARRRLPEPFLEDDPAWIDLYWDAWRFMHEKLTRGDVSKGFVPFYIDEGFNENIYQWDSCFMAAYALYGLEVFPAMAALDNFYNLQRADGYICRTYNENTGRATGEADINPPLFAWIEHRYWRATGDSSRLPRVLPILDRYFQWCKTNARGPRGGGLYWITDLGSGMDNSPREEWVRRGAWIDISAQQALAARSIAALARVAGDTSLADRYEGEFAALAALINERLWHEEHGTYLDRTEDGAWHTRFTIASFWPMVAGVADERQSRRLIAEHLRNPRSFGRAHPFPTLSAEDPVYDPRGHYWRGGVWAPTTYAVIKGIERFDRAFAREAAARHIAAMARVHASFRPDGRRNRLPSLVEPNIARNGDGVRQIWEAYAPDTDAPATRWDAELLVRQKFCGWSGLGPVALLVENVLGLDVDVPANTLTWRITRTDRHGIRRLGFGDGTVSLAAARRTSPEAPLVITGTATRALRLVVHHGDDTEPALVRDLAAGRRFRFVVPSP